jgi:two-component system nitrate/nitrite response regulator NarL
MRNKSSITIAVADDQPIFRLGLKALLTQSTGFTLLGEASDTEAAFALVADVAPDILLVDHVPPRLNGLEVVRRVRAAKSPTRAVLLTAAMREADIQQALLHGAWGVVLKHTAGDVLPQCLRQVMLGEHWIGVESVNALIGSLRTPSTGGSTQLTPREVDIVRRVAKGASNKDIAWELKMGEQTVKNHLRRVFRKLHVANRVELALLAVEHQIGNEATSVPDAPGANVTPTPTP